MKKISHSLCRVRLVAFAAALIASGAQAQDLQFGAGPYKYFVVDQDLKQVLMEFGRNMNVAVKVSDDIQGRVRGPLPASTPEEFLKRLCDAYGLVQYFDGSVLHVSAESELRTEAMEFGTARPDDVSARLKEFDMADRRFRVSLNSDAGVVTVSGSSPYVARVRESIAALAKSRNQRTEAVADDKRVRVYRGGS